MLSHKLRVFKLLVRIMMFRSQVILWPTDNRLAVLRIAGGVRIGGGQGRLLPFQKCPLRSKNTR